MSYQDNVDVFNESLQKQTWWARLLGSQFVLGLALFIGQMVERCETLATRLLQECFFSTAVKRASILAAAEDRGYVGRKITPSTGKISIVNNTGSTLLFPYGATLTAPNRLPYILAESIRVEAGATVTAEIAQLEEVVFTTTVTTKQKWLEVLLSKEVTAKAASVDVMVTLPNKATEQWEKRFLFRRAIETSQVYTEFYKPTEQLGVRFGNGVSGRIPDVGSVITLNVWCSSGDTTLLEGQILTFDDLTTEQSRLVSVVTTTPITGGAAGESTEEIRAGAMYATPYDNQIVWDNDYQQFIRNNIGGLSWVRVWGEVQQEEESGYSLNNIGRIYISAYSPNYSQSALAEKILELFATTKELNRRYSYVNCNLCPFTITVNGIIGVRQQREAVAQAIQTMIKERFGRDIITEKDGDILEKDIWTAIDELAVMDDFKITLNDKKINPLLADYVFLDESASIYNMEYSS